MKYFFKPIIIISILLINLNSYCQNTHYLSPTGNDTLDGSELHPWKTLKKLRYHLLNPGDKGILRGGTYPGYVTFNQSTTGGTAMNPIVIEAYTDEAVIISGDSLHANPDNLASIPHLINIQNAYFTLRNIELQHAANTSVAVHANHVTLDNLNIHNGYHSGISGDQFYTTVTNCVLHDFFDWNSYGQPTIGGGNADGISFSTGGYHIISNNVVYNCSDDGIDTWNTTGNLIEKNIVHNTGYSNSANLESPYTNGLAAGNGNGFKMGGAGSSGYNIVRKNVSYANRTSGFDGNEGIYNEFYNNTSYNNPTGYRNLNITYKLKNNLAINNSTASTDGTLSTNTTLVDKNSWNLSITDPNFVNPTGTPPDFHLNPTLINKYGVAFGPAIDKGVVVSGISYVGSKPDIGAYEYGEDFIEKNSHFINQGEVSQKIIIFPNPIQEEVNISSFESEIKSIMITTIDGKTIYYNNNINDFSYKLDSANYTKGIYIVNIETMDNNSVIQKIIKN